MGNPIQPQAMLDNKRKWSLLAHLSLSLSPSPLESYLKYLELDGGAGMLEAVSSAPMRGASLGLIGLWVAPHSAQHEAVLHSWSLYIFHALRRDCLQKEQHSSPINMEKCLKK